MTMFLIFLAFLITEKFLVQTQLSPGGANVCSRIISYTAYNLTFKTRIGYDYHTTCCKRFAGFCTSTCTRSRTKRINYYENVAITRYKQDYYCCTGWPAMSISANVCSRIISYTAYNLTFKTRIGYDYYTTCCKRFASFCTSTCTRSRTKRINYYENVATTRYKQDYYCCT